MAVPFRSAGTGSWEHERRGWAVAAPPRKPTPRRANSAAWGSGFTAGPGRKHSDRRGRAVIGRAGGSRAGRLRKDQQRDRGRALPQRENDRDTHLGTPAVEAPVITDGNQRFDCPWAHSDAERRLFPLFAWFSPHRGCWSLREWLR